MLSVMVAGCKLEVAHDPKAAIELTSTPLSPEIFGEGIISTSLYERDIAIHPSGNELIYTLADYKQNRRCLVVLQKTEQGWSEPRILPFSGQYQDIEPFFAHEGERLFFASNRPIFQDSSRNDYNIWYSDRKAGSWGEPQALSEAVNQKGDEFFPSVSESGNLYFTAARQAGPGREDIYYAKAGKDGFEQAVPLDSNINTALFEFNAYISPKEDLIVFSSFGRADDMGGGDLYYSIKDSMGNWMPSSNMGAGINSEKLDYSPFIDWERGNFYFTSERVEQLPASWKEVAELRAYANQYGNGFGNIFRVSLEKLELTPRQE